MESGARSVGDYGTVRSAVYHSRPRRCNRGYSLVYPVSMKRMVGIVCMVRLLPLSPSWRSSQS